PKSTGCSKTPEIHARSDEPRRPQPQPAHGWFRWLASVRTGVALTLVSDEEHELLDLRPLRHTDAEELAVPASRIPGYFARLWREVLLASKADTVGSAGCSHSQHSSSPTTPDASASARSVGASASRRSPAVAVIPSG